MYTSHALHKDPTAEIQNPIEILDCYDESIWMSPWPQLSLSQGILVYILFLNNSKYNWNSKYISYFDSSQFQTNHVSLKHVMLFLK